MIRTKIIATVGPASESPETLRRLIEAGVDVFRLNFSHGTLEQHARVFERIRAASRELGRFVAVMGDLCGPKIRVDPIEDDAFEICPGDRIEIVEGHVVGTPRRISTNRPELIGEVAVGHRLFIDDGSVRLRVEAAGEDHLRCVCEVGGRIATRKGINVPDSEPAMSALTAEDRENLAWACARGVDYIAMSFVRSAADLAELRRLLPDRDDACRLVAKIETAHAVRRLDEIIEAADVVLVARGDLGVEMDLARVPLVQKDITARCAAAGKPVIIATQMLQSMVGSPTATRAEVSDVSNAILDGADCVMLSAETSVGSFPVHSVEMMATIAEKTEAFLCERAPAGRIRGAPSARPVATAVAHAAALLAGELHARLVAVWTQSGNTARLLSKCRMDARIIGLSPDEHVCRRMCLYYGVQPVRMARRPQLVDMLRDVDDMLLERGWARTGDPLIAVAGTQLRQIGSANALLIHLLGSTETGSPEITG